MILGGAIPAGLTLLAGLIFLVFGAEGLVRGGHSIGSRLELTPLFMGLTFVAFGTSAPELAVSIQSGLQGKGDISVANVIGSNIFNIAVILGITAVITPIKVYLSVIKRDIPVMIIVSAVAFLLTTQGEIRRVSGFFLTSTLIIYITLTYYMARREMSVGAGPDPEDSVPRPEGSIWKEIVFVSGGIALMIVGSNLLIQSISQIARLIGLSEAVIGLTVVAAGTSFPELATSIVAALRRQPEMAVGNVVGSNIFNILGILGISSLITPLTSPGIDRVDLGVMVIFAVILLPLAWTGKMLTRWEGGLLLCGYALYLWWLWPSTPIS